MTRNIDRAYNVRKVLQIGEEGVYVFEEHRLLCMFQNQRSVNWHYTQRNNSVIRQYERLLSLHEGFTLILYDFTCNLFSKTVQDVETTAIDVEITVQDVETKDNPVNLTTFSYWSFSTGSLIWNNMNYS